jgi:hypothetical protein
MMFSIVYFLKRRCNISGFSTEFLLLVVLWAQLQGGNSRGNRIKFVPRFLRASIKSNYPDYVVDSTNDRLEVSVCN